MSRISSRALKHGATVKARILAGSAGIDMADSPEACEMLTATVGLHLEGVTALSENQLAESIHAALQRNSSRVAPPSAW